MQVLGDRYEVQQQLAKKAGRRTLLARDLETQELVVVKLLSFSGDFEWDDLKLFQREAETLKAISHPFIPRYLDYFELDLDNFKGFALVQTYIQAKSLDEYLKAGRTFSEAEVKELAIALLEILIYLHNRQPAVIHRDIKPSNILLSDRTGNSVGQVYLVDFGSVQTLAAREGGTITVVGTYGYMPPEQFGDRTVPASDLYSLGATLIALVTGTHPADLPQKEGRIQFEQLTNFSPELSSWLKWMTQPSLDKRLTSAQAALQALEQPQQRIESVAIAKPFDTKIRLIKSDKSLEILLPAKGYEARILGLILFSIVWNLFLLPVTIAMLVVVFFSPIFFSILLVFVLPSWYVNYHVLKDIVNPLFNRVRLEINPQQLILTNELFSWKYKHRSAPRQEISVLKIAHGISGKLQDISIWAGRQTYYFGSDIGLTEPEIEWLAQELSEWLGLPITRPYSSSRSEFRGKR